MSLKEARPQVVNNLGLVLFAFAVLSAIHFGNTGTAFACSCAPAPSPQELLAAEDVVLFAGRTILVFPTSLINENAVFLVDKSWKGVDEKIVVVSTASQGTMCGSNFEVGHEYLVYAGEYNGGLVSGSCGRTQPLSHADADIQRLEENIKPIPIQNLIRFDSGSLPVIGIGAAIASVIAFFTLRRRRH